MKNFFIAAFSLCLILFQGACEKVPNSAKQHEEVYDIKGDIAFTPLDATKITALEKFNKPLKNDWETNPPRVEVEKILHDFFFQDIDLKKAVLKAGFISLNSKYKDENEKVTIKAAIDKIMLMSKQEIISKAENFDEIINENLTPIQNYQFLLLALLYTNFYFENNNYDLKNLDDEIIKPYLNRIKKLSGVEITKIPTKYPQELFTNLFELI